MYSELFQGEAFLGWKLMIRLFNPVPWNRRASCPQRTLQARF